MTGREKIWSVTQQIGIPLITCWVLVLEQPQTTALQNALPALCLVWVRDQQPREAPANFPEEAPLVVDLSTSLCFTCFRSVLENTDTDPGLVPAAAGAFYEWGPEGGGKGLHHTSIG
jgi:hypothetical protein